jgi:hypothetical protein
MGDKQIFVRERLVRFLFETYDCSNQHPFTFCSNVLHTYPKTEYYCSLKANLLCKFDL